MIYDRRINGSGYKVNDDKTKDQMYSQNLCIKYLLLKLSKN